MTPKRDQTQARPFNRWPVGRGFEKYYGFLGGATDQYRPILWEGTNKIEKDYVDKRLLSELITDRAINYIANQKSAAPEKPFFLYYGLAATHSPHHGAMSLKASLIRAGIGKALYVGRCAHRSAL